MLQDFVPAVVLLYEEQQLNYIIMKEFARLLCSLIMLGILPAGAQTTVTFTGNQPLTPLTFAQRVAQASNQDQPKLTTFDLDFPGGTPAELVNAIEKATGKPLNAIIRTEDADTQLPPLKMNKVVVPRLFAALGAASQQTVEVSIGGFGNAYTQNQIGYGFRTSDNPATDNSIWNFYVDKPTLPPVVSTQPICRFYQLQSYLNRGFTVDDITTAIQTGWKMAGITSTPELNYHKETKLLIAFGPPEELATIQNVLDALPMSNASAKDVTQLQKDVTRMQNQIDQLDKKVSENSGK